MDDIISLLLRKKTTNKAMVRYNTCTVSDNDGTWKIKRRHIQFTRGWMGSDYQQNFWKN